MTTTTITFTDEMLAEFLAWINRAHLPATNVPYPSRVSLRVHTYPDGTGVLEETLWTRPE